MIPQTVSVFAQVVDDSLTTAFADAGIKANIHSLDTLNVDSAAALAKGELQSADAIAIVMNKAVDAAQLTNDEAAALQETTNDALFSLIKANTEHKVKLDAGLLVLTQNSVTAEADDEINKVPLRALIRARPVRE